MNQFEGSESVVPVVETLVQNFALNRCDRRLDWLKIAEGVDGLPKDGTKGFGRIFQGLSKVVEFP